MSTLTDIPFTVFESANSIPVFYSSPTQTHSEKDVDRFIERLKPLQTKPWVWIVDCRASWITLNPVVVYRLKTYLETHHATSLQAVWVVNLSGWMRGMFGMLTTKKLRILPSEPLGMFVTMNKEGYSSELVTRLLEVLVVVSA